MKTHIPNKMINSNVQIKATVTGFHLTSNVANKIDLKHESELVIVVNDVPNGTHQPSNEEFVIDRFDKRVLTFSNKDYFPLGKCETIIEINSAEKEACCALGLACWNEEREADGMIYCRRSNLFLLCKLKQIVLPTSKKQKNAVPLRNVIDFRDDEVIENLFKNTEI